MASSAENQRSRSASVSICSNGRPECWEMSSNMRFFMYENSCAWIAMSAAWPRRPASGWCMMMRALGSE